MAKRQLENWLDSFTEWVMPRSEAPESMVRWTGLFTLSAVAKRKVCWPRRLLGGYEVYPNLYVVFVADPAVVRKSTTVGFAQELLDHSALTGLNSVTFAGNVTSHSKLINAMMDSPDQSVAVIAGELSSLIQTTPEAMYEILIDLYDNKKVFRWETWQHGNKLSENPVINLFAATTPAWISEQPPAYFVEGGFASRVIFVFEEEPRQREIYYDHLDHDKLDKLGEALAQDLVVISGIKGEFTHDTPKTKEKIRSWYQKQRVRVDDPRIKSFHGRKHTHAHKISMLISMAEREDRVVTWKHWEEAVALLDYVEERLPSAFATLGAGQYGLLMEKIIKFVATKGKASRQQIAGRFYTEGITIEQLNSALVFLCVAQKLKAKGVENPVYEIASD